MSDIDEEERVYEEEEYDEPERLAEMGAFDRVTQAQGGLSLKTQMHIATREVMSPAERLDAMLDIIYRDFEDDEMVGSVVDQASVETIKDRSKKLPNPQFVNPVGLIIGYIAENEGVDYVFKMLERNYTVVLDANVQKPDVIRYLRLWRSIK